MKKGNAFLSYTTRFTCSIKGGYIISRQLGLILFFSWFTMRAVCGLVDTIITIGDGNYEIF
tara:strand:+ start:290 stop:472 length:183 start_codon:yes stop_codon:yes gene_type:complete